MGLFDEIIDMAPGPIGDIADGIGTILTAVFPQMDEISTSFFNFDGQLNDLVTSPIQEFIGDIEEGGIWEGDGAEAFKEECRSIFLTQNQQLQSGLSAFGGLLQNAKGIMQETDKKALTQVNNFADAVSKIIV